MPLPLVIAHRGDSSRALENSLEAVRLALSLPADMVEVDVRMSRDNQLYVIHDKDTARTAAPNIDIERSESGEIAPVKLKNGEPIPTLKDVLNLISGKVGLNLEIKSDGAGGLAAAHLSGLGYRGQVLISSFKEREVIDARRVAPNLTFSEIFDDFTLQDLKKYAAKGYGVVSLKRSAATRELMDACHNRKIKVYVWTVDDDEEMRKFIEWGADGIYTNRPAALKGLLQSLAGQA
jgi:glycerophosphoryl diester phosphodiesterase